VFYKLAKSDSNEVDKLKACIVGETDDESLAIIAEHAANRAGV